MEGRLPRGFCVKRLTDLPMLWSEQSRALGRRRQFSCRPNPVDRRYGYPLQSFLRAKLATAKPRSGVFLSWSGLPGHDNTCGPSRVKGVLFR